MTQDPFRTVIEQRKSLPKRKELSERDVDRLDRSLKVLANTVGLLQRRHIKIDLIKCIGKESNSLESVDEGLEHSERNVYTEYSDPKRTEWITKIQPALRNAKLALLVKACAERLSRREIIELRAGRKKPHRKTQQLLESILTRLGFL